MATTKELIKKTVDSKEMQSWLSKVLNISMSRVKIMAVFLDSLTEREREIIVLRHKGHTLKEVGDIVGVTKERIRQIEAKTKAKAEHYLENK